MKRFNDQSRHMKIKTAKARSKLYNQHLDEFIEVEFSEFESEQKQDLKSTLSQIIYPKKAA